MINSKGKKRFKFFPWTALFFIVVLGLAHFINTQRLKSNAQKEYEKFLSGQSEAMSGNMKLCTMKELFEQGDSVSYLYCDIDCDGVSELHIRSARFYYILKYENDLLKIIYYGTAYEYPVKSKALCGVLYCRHGGAPTNTVYRFTTINQDGAKAGPEYGWYDTNENNVNDEGDLYIVDDTEMDMTTWLGLTDLYREYAEDENQELEWIVNQE